MTKIVVLILSVGTLLTAFQNCGGVKFNQDSASIQTAQSASLGAEPDDASDLPTLEEAAVTCDLLPAAVATTNAIRLIQNVSNPGVIADVGQLTIIDVTGRVRAERIDRLNAANVRGSLSAAVAKAAVLDVRGSVCLSVASELSLLQNIKGPAVVRGNAARPTKVRGILDVGDLKLIDAEADLIQNVHGRLILVRAHVARLQDMTGRLDLTEGSSVGSVVDSPSLEIYRDGVRVN